MADRLVDVRCAVDCPHCGQETDARFDSLAGSGTVPRELQECDQCGEPFFIYSTIDIGIHKP